MPREVTVKTNTLDGRNVEMQLIEILVDNSRESLRSTSREGHYVGGQYFIRLLVETLGLVKSKPDTLIIHTMGALVHSQSGH